MGWWLSGEVQGKACKRRGFKSRSRPVCFFFFFFFFGLDIVKVMYSFFLAFVKGPYVQFKKKVPIRISIKT